MTERAVEEFAALLHARTGIRVSDTILRRTESLLQVRAHERGFADLAAYVRGLAAGDADELQTLVNLITVNKTSFARYPEQMEALVREILPVLDRAVPGGAPINIWSAACSTGEEPYTVAAVLAESGWSERRRFTLMATDINTKALEAARAGRYYLAATDALPGYLKRCLAADGTVLTVDMAVRQRVTFERLNLSADPYPEVGGWHVIICANVLIYFDVETTTRVIAKFGSVMAPTSVLLLGGTESLSRIHSDFELTQIGAVYGYVRGDAWRRAGRTRPVAVRVPAPALPPADLQAPSPFSPPLVTPPAGLMRPPSAAGGAPPAAGGLDPLQPSAQYARLKAEVDRALRLADEGDRARAITALAELKSRTPGHPRVERALALQLLAARRFAEASEAFNEAIAADPLAFDLYFYQGWLLLNRLGRIEHAGEALRRALFIEPGFAYARYEFALALHASGDLNAAVAEYRRAEQTALQSTGRQTLIERALGSSESFWFNTEFVVELCRTNRQRASRGQEPLTSPAASAPIGR